MKKEKECPNCKGNGGFEVGIPCDPNYTIYISDGECMELGWKDCFWCSGKGKVTEERILEVKNIKKHNC